MRLSSDAQNTIVESTREIFGPEAYVKFFGSRLNDASKDGDLDLLIETSTPIANARRKSLQLVARLQIKPGDQPIGVIVVDPSTDYSLFISKP